jgi:hypothetical protein
MDPKWIKMGIAVAFAVMGVTVGGTGGMAVGIHQTKTYRLENETALQTEITKLKGDLKSCRNAPIEAEWVTEKGKTKCWTRKVLSGG